MRYRVIIRILGANDSDPSVLVWLPVSIMVRLLSSVSFQA